MLYNDTWGTICSRNLNWETKLIICRQLGFPTSSKKKNKISVSPGTGPIWLNKVNCLGHESSIGICQNNGWGNHNCSHNEDAVLSCYDRMSRFSVIF